MNKLKIACGTDIIEIDRIEKSIKQSGEKFLNRVYTEKEIQYCESKKGQKYQHYAARFAAKEAVFKALTIKIENKYEIEWKDIEITNNEQGRPKVTLSPKIQEKLEILDMDISLSHCKNYATANVIMFFDVF